PGLAVLLARVAAAHAGLADLLAAAAARPVPGPVVPQTPATDAGTDTATPAAAGSAAGTAGATATGNPSGPAGTASPGTPRPTSTPLPSAAVTALGRLLQGEHAAAYAYGPITAWLVPAQRDQARACWQAHLGERDDLTTLLSSGGAPAPAASPAYDLGDAPANPAGAVTLASGVEDRVATLAAAAVGPASGPARLAAAGILVASVRRSAGWTRTVAALPGGN
ncbi:MAG TPA: DUF4439 domain-containing protein, partial [Kineosporiaceae bacterium]|nr:DUF4439 domain-containing protein [Kineosporiaceae bacterium]